MAKKKPKSPKLPKEVAGVKVPKALRRKGEELIAKAASPEGRAAIVKGLTVAATLANIAVERGRAAGAVERDNAAKPGAPQSSTKPQAAAPANDPAPLDPEKVAQAVGTVADAVLGRLFPNKRA